MPILPGDVLLDKVHGPCHVSPLVEFGVVVAAPGRGLGGPERTTADTDTGLGLALLLSAAVATENWRN